MHVRLIESVWLYAVYFAFYGNSRKAIISDLSHSAFMLHLGSRAHRRLSDSLASLIISPLVLCTALVIVNGIIVEACVCNAFTHALLLYLGQLKRLVPSVFALASARHVESSLLISWQENVSGHFTIASARSGANGIRHRAISGTRSMRFHESCLVLATSLGNHSSVKSSLATSRGLATLSLVHEVSIQSLSVWSTSCEHHVLFTFTWLD